MAIAALAVGSPASAYWDFPHKVIASIAWSELSPLAKAKARRLMAHAPELATPNCPIRTIQDASVWADCVKQGERFSYAFSWHFQNIDVCKPFDIKANCPFGNCGSAQITRNLALLKDKSLPRRERLQAFAFVVHLVGDLHQPLHAADRSDLGGNRTAASYGGAGGRNLHLIWDGYLPERAITEPPGNAAGLLADVAQADRSALAAGTVEDWSRENWEVTRDHVYAPLSSEGACGARPNPVLLDSGKIAAAIPVLRRQVTRGGLRLARLLEEALR